MGLHHRKEVTNNDQIAPFYCIGLDSRNPSWGQLPIAPAPFRADSSLMKTDPETMTTSRRAPLTDVDARTRNEWKGREMSTNAEATRPEGAAVMRASEIR